MKAAPILAAPLLALAAAALLASPATAGSPDSLARTEMVSRLATAHLARIETPAGMRLVEEPRAFVLGICRGDVRQPAATDCVHWDEITGVKVERRHTVTGALVGAAVGAIAGTLVAYANPTQPKSPAVTAGTTAGLAPQDGGEDGEGGDGGGGGEGFHATGVVAALGCTALGTALGALIGARLPRWFTVYPARVGP